MWTAHAQSKPANMVFISELARRGIRVYASDPGMAARDSTSGLHWLGERLLGHLGQSPPKPRAPPAKRSTAATAQQAVGYGTLRRIDQLRLADTSEQPSRCARHLNAYNPRPHPGILEFA
jgi:hypothetical protein